MSYSAETLFISDLHLSQTKPEITQNFLTFIKTRAQQARVLYILGDLFEVWVGDDDPAIEFAAVFQALEQLSQTTKIYFLHGNRDFLVGKALAQRLNITLLSDPRIIILGDQTIGLTHGDLLCSDDTEYLEFRASVRTTQWIRDFLAKPLPERQSIAADLRAKSLQAMQSKSLEIMDVNQETVRNTFEELNIDTLIHGHTHRPGVHIIDQNRTRLVLGDWHPQPSFISWKDNQLTLVDTRIN
mgnify:CR=1 FL=1